MQFLLKSHYSKYIGLTQIVLVNLGKFASSRLFIRLTLVLFALQASFFALTIQSYVPADEKYHVNLIQFYSHRDIWNGPFVADQPREEVHHGDRERNPSYLYHYLLSFPARLINYANMSEGETVVAMRMISVAIGLGSLVVFRKITQEMWQDNKVSNLSTFLLSMVGMYVYIHAAVNYDALSFLLFFLYIMYSMRTIAERSAVPLFIATIFAFALSITKVTYIPILVGSYVLVLILLLPFNPKSILIDAKNKLKSSWLSQGHKVIVVCAIFGILLALVGERYLGNVLMYKSLQPSCAVIHSHNACLTNGIYKRDVELRYEYGKEIENGRTPVKFEPFRFTGDWLHSMYQNLYFYSGHKSIRPSELTYIMAFITSIGLLLVLLLASKPKLITGKVDLYLLSVALGYVLILYSFHLSSWFAFGAKYSYAGRYLLPVVGFFIAFACVLVIQQLRKLSIASRAFIAPPVVIFGFVVIFAHNPMFSFWLDANQAWFMNSIREVFPLWLYNQYINL